MEGRASWLLHIISTRFTYHEGEPHILIRIFGFVLYDNRKPKVPKIKKQKKEIKKNTIKKNAVKKEVIKKEVIKKGIIEKRTKKTSEINTDVGKRNAEYKNELSIPQTKSASEHKKDKLLLNESKSDTIRIVKTEKQIQENDGSLIEEEVDSQLDPIIKPVIYEVKQEQKGIKREKTSLLQNILIKIKNWKEKINMFFIELKNKIIKGFEVAANIKQKISLITDFIKDELNREGFHITYSSLKKLLKHILPTKLKSRIIFGTGDPCTTGQALGFMGILYSFYGDKIQIIPDFENIRLEGKHDARGRIRLITIILIVIKLMFDKRFKQLKRNFIILKEAL
jgi:hypothetical protein